MLSFTVAEYLANSIVPLEPFELRSYTLLVGTIDHSQIIPSLPDFFNETQKKLLSDPKVVEILRSMDGDTIVTLFDSLPSENNELVCFPDRYSGTKNVIIVPDFWILRNRKTCLICRGSRKRAQNSRNGSDRQSDGPADSADFTLLSEAEEQDEDSRCECSRLSDEPDQLPEPVFDIEGHHRRINAERRRRRLLNEHRPPISRQRAETPETPEGLEQETEYLPRETLKQIKRELVSQNLYFEAIYRWQKTPEELDEFGHVSIHLRKTLTKVFQDAFNTIPDYDEGFYIVEVLIPSYNKSNRKCQINVPVKIIKEQQA
ncbi:unnamed protein product [Caenorhabditis angaria]|uniref:Uncharacterized protein n=1 Tax=Caenorhabditis angaria TaxID=860376 RepID=A0A9P1NC76_9PELO|nr:unnamed protein product [Caenorhabditis angaria]